MNMDKVIKQTSIIVTRIALIALISFIFSYPIMLLWNGCLVPAIDGANSVTWLQAWGLTVLFNTLFKGSTPSKD